MAMSCCCLFTCIVATSYVYLSKHFKGTMKSLGGRKHLFAPLKYAYRWNICIEAGSLGYAILLYS